MFNNFVNRHDLHTLVERGPRLALRTVAKFAQSKHRRVQSAWQHSSAPPTNWWNIPAVRARWNALISGDPALDYRQYALQKFLSQRRDLIALSPGCGTGHREIQWAKLDAFSRIDAYDLSEPRIEEARKRARESECDNIVHFHSGDIYALDLPRDHYDIVFAEQSLHHFSPLEPLLTRLRASLKPDGYFLVNEFVGPTRFQWTDRQLEVVNGLLSTLPEECRRIWRTGALKRRVFRPSKLRMVLTDPSEAIESARIVPLLEEMFEVTELTGYGGTVLHLLLNGIAHHFTSDDAPCRRLLDSCFAIEDALIESGELASDYAFAVCRKRR